MTLIAALIALIILLGLAIFQLCLILGAPFGEYAWGGQHKTLPKKLRIGSATSIILYILFAAFIVSKVGLVTIIDNQTLVDVGVWVIAVYTLLGIPLNAISRSTKERMVMTPLVSILAATMLITALS